MSTPRRIQLSRQPGWRMPPDTVNCARPGKWGNMFHVGDFGDAQQCVSAYRNWLEECLAHPTTRNVTRLALQKLRGKDLACWCKPGEPCHADVLLEVANR